MYSTCLTKIRDRRGPQDSGEWPPVTFRRLNKPAQKVASPAPTIIASLLVLAGYVASALLLDAEFAALLAIVLSPIFGGIGVAWISQFRCMDRSESAWHGLAWGVAGFGLMAVVHPLLIVGFLCAGLTGGGSALGAWLAARVLNGRDSHGNA